MALYSGFTHQKWWFSIAMLVYQRVSSIIHALSSPNDRVLHEIQRIATFQGAQAVEPIFRHDHGDSLAFQRLSLVTRRHVMSKTCPRDVQDMSKTLGSLRHFDQSRWLEKSCFISTKMGLYKPQHTKWGSIGLSLQHMTHHITHHITSHYSSHYSSDSSNSIRFRFWDFPVYRWRDRASSRPEIRGSNSAHLIFHTGNSISAVHINGLVLWGKFTGNHRFSHQIYRNEHKNPTFDGLVCFVRKIYRKP